MTMKENEKMIKQSECKTMEVEQNALRGNKCKLAEVEQSEFERNEFRTDEMLQHATGQNEIGQNATGQNEIGELSNELTYRRYLMNKDKIRELFQKVSVAEYIALYKIAFQGENSSLYSGKTYLKELAEKMELTIPQTSKMVEGLQDRGLVLWSHDGDGSEGTYVMITENGQKLFKEQEDVLKSFYEKVVAKFGKEKLIQLLQLMQELDKVMGFELKDIAAFDEC